MDDKDRIKSLEDELLSTKLELQATKEHLKKYTAPARNKTYYDNHKDRIKARNYNNNTTPDQRSEYNKRAYNKKKEKLKKEQESQNI